MGFFPVIFWSAKTKFSLCLFILNTRYGIGILKVVKKYLTKELMSEGISDCIVTLILRQYQLDNYTLELIVLLIHK